MRLPRLASFVVAGFALTALAISDPAPAQPSPSAKTAPRQCFFASRVNSFNAVDRDTVRVRVGVRDYYELDLVGICPEIDWTHRIALVTRGGGSSVCMGFDADILVPQPGGRPQRCTVRAVRKLSDAEAEVARRGRSR